MVFSSRSVFTVTQKKPKTMDLLIETIGDDLEVKSVNSLSATSCVPRFLFFVLSVDQRYWLPLKYCGVGYPLTAPRPPL